MTVEGFGNTLYYGDNLKVLRDYVPDESVDLVYLDPPFNSNASYNILFKERTGQESAAQIRAFEDTWHWGEESERAYAELLESPLAPAMAKEMVASLRRALGDKNDMTAYLAMMAIRLVELRRVLKPTGSLYLHCDPTASHYLKVVLDTIFGKENFRNEIIWKRTQAHNDPKRCGNVHDAILNFVKDSNQATWYGGGHKVSDEYLKSHYSKVDALGRRYQLVVCHAPGPGPARTFFGREIEPPPGRHWTWTQENIDRLIAEDRIVLTKTGGPRLVQFAPDTVPLQDVWTDVDPVNSQAKERLGYATQKPLALLERIIQASSNAGDVVLDPFCGCGTAVAAAHKLDRRWIGIDVTHLAIALMKNRLKGNFDLEPVYRLRKDEALAPNQYRVIGEPEDVEGAKELAREDRDEFQYWAVSLVTGQPRQSSKKGADRGVDGVIFFVDGPQRSANKAIIQVKSGHVVSPLVRDLKGVLEREKAALGLFITLEEPTRDMKAEAASAGFFHSDLMERDYPKVQLRTIAELLGGKGFELPPRPAQFKQAQRVRRREGVQGPLEIE
ncbi:MAG: restriction endonuclease [Chloroflexi bacterium]|nr:restriction endonuclease [Chloroflexota bacterium]